jgi:hypothetical protein
MDAPNIASTHIQIGLRKAAVELYITKWIQKISDITDVAHAVHDLVAANKLDQAKSMLPAERIYPHITG